MPVIFDYDWFTGPAFAGQREQARMRCAHKRYPQVNPGNGEACAEFQRFLAELEVRSLIYLRDGFSYEMKDLVDLGLHGLLTFECEPVDEQYKVGSFIVSVPFEEIMRVEVFAVHPAEKPEDMPIITGFRHKPPEYGPPRAEEPREFLIDPPEIGE